MEGLGRMHDVRPFHIRVEGQVDESTLNATSPLQVTVAQRDVDKEHPSDVTLLATCADQAGLIGLMRHLHRHGFVILSVSVNEGPYFPGGTNERPDTS
jgi:hypothetical protein